MQVGPPYMRRVNRMLVGASGFHFGPFRSTLRALLSTYAIARRTRNLGAVFESIDTDDCGSGGHITAVECNSELHKTGVVSTAASSSPSLRTKLIKARANTLQDGTCPTVRAIYILHIVNPSTTFD
jgi:hypothetical protein